MFAGKLVDMFYTLCYSSIRCAVTFACVVLVLILSVDVAHAEHPSTVQIITQAQFDAPGLGASTVTLPDTWAHRGVPAHTPGRYRLEFTLDAVPEESLALTFSRLSTHHSVWINGTLVARHVHATPQAKSNMPVPVLIEVPLSFSRAGLNAVEIEVAYRKRAGLSVMEVGPMSAVRPIHQRRMQAQVALPQSLNLAVAGLAVFMITIWWRRRQEVALGSFGALVLLSGLRYYAYFLDTAVGSGQWWEAALFFGAQVASTYFVGTFAQAFAEVRWPIYRRLLSSTLISFSCVGVIAAWLDQMQVLTMIAHPWLLLLCMPAVWLCIRRIWQNSTIDRLGQLSGIVVLVGAAAHDYVTQTAQRLPITELVWMPYAIPIALGAFSLGLLGRITNALNVAEASNTLLEERVAERTQALERANVAKTRFLASASHDLRQPLATVGLLVGLVKERNQSADLNSLLNRLDTAVGSMEDLLKGLLDLSQLESGAVSPVRSPIRLADLFKAIEAHEQAAAAMKGLTLRFNLNDAVVVSDAVMLERIVRNLVSNAVRYTQRGGVLVCARRRAEFWRIAVYDTGVGIAADQHEAIFQEFVQLHNPERDRTQGLGLGLAIVQRSATVLGHRIGLRSKPGRGSCFWIDVPRADHAPARAASSAATPTLSGLNALVVDDDSAVRDALAERLAAWGAVTYACGNIEALRHWLNNSAPLRLDLVLLDHRLPDGNGLQALELVRKRFDNVPALLTTGDTAPDVLAQLTQAGVPVLHKPFRTEALAQAIVPLVNASTER